MESHACNRRGVRNEAKFSQMEYKKNMGNSHLKVDTVFSGKKRENLMDSSDPLLISICFIVPFLIAVVIVFVFKKYLELPKKRQARPTDNAVT